MRRNAMAVLWFLVAVGACSYNPGGTTTTSPTGTSLSLIGRVTDTSSGAGVSAANLSIESGSNAGKSATTDGGGNFLLADLQASEFSLTVTASSYATESKHVALTANQTLLVQLAKCTAALSVGSRIDASSIGGSYPVTVTTPSGCAWTATTTAAWIHLPALGTRIGTDTFAFTLDENADAARTGDLTIAGHSIAVVQAGRAAS